MDAPAWAAAIRRVFADAGLEPDSAQGAAMVRLGQLAADIQERRAKTFLPFAGRRSPPRGVFLWGGVGRGKTRLVDALVGVLPPGLARRYHQHAFLDAFHGALDPGGGAEPFNRAVMALLGEARLLVLDEFHAYDVADALILGRALSVLAAAGVAIALTANHLPAALWPGTAFHAGGRRHFDPAARLIESHCDLIQVDGGRDYRELVRPGAARWWLTASLESPAAGAWANFPDAVWEFRELCGGLYRHGDYLELCRGLSCLVLLGLPRFGPGHGDELRRLVWLADVVWERGLPMAVTADAPVDELFAGIGEGLECLMGKDLKRTGSRLAALVRL